MKKWLFWLALVAVFFAWRFEPKANWRGIPAAREPLQTSEHLPAAFRNGQATITPLARYSITAIVLSRDRYRFDPAADIAPVDLALGWGPMSIASVINDLKISQSGRWYSYQYSGEPPLDPASIAVHSANTHCLPADNNVRKRLLRVRRHQLVTLEGFLVQVDGDDGSHWRSSLTRSDEGGGACEVLWVTQVSTREP